MPTDSAPAADTAKPERGADGQMTLREHLIELRKRIVKSVIAVTIGVIIAWALYSQLFAFLSEPYCKFVATQNQPCRLISTEPLDQLQFRLQVSTYGGLFLAAPVLFYQLWRFISPGLRSNERRYATMFVGSSMLLFVLGAACAYFTMPKALDFLLTIGGDQIQQLMRVSSYMSFLMFTMLAFGLGFQFPILLVALQLVGVLRTSSLVRWRRESFVGIVFIAAVLTPSVDPFSLFALAIPMYLFYELSIVIGRTFTRGRQAS